MLATVLAVILFFALLSVILLVGLRTYSKPGRVQERMGAPVIATATALNVLAQAHWSVGLLQKLGKLVPISEESTSVVREDLVTAGYRSERAPMILAGVRIAAAVGLLLLLLLLRSRMPENPMLRTMLPICGGGIGFILPSFFLTKVIRKRQESIRMGLPDALDLLVISVEAGLGMDQALNYVGKELVAAHPTLSEELNLMTLEMRAGKRRSDALMNLALRTGEPDVRKLVSVLTQTDRFGTSMGEALRQHSVYMRAERKQQAEERAAKVGVKLVFPIFFFIMPAMLVVSVGPGILSLFKHLFPMMKNFSG